MLFKYLNNIAVTIIRSIKIIKFLVSLFVEIILCTISLQVWSAAPKTSFLFLNSYNFILLIPGFIIASFDPDVASYTYAISVDA